MGKDNRQHSDDYDEEREERYLQQIHEHRRKVHASKPLTPPGHYHETDGCKRPRKQRKKERGRLKNLTKEYNDNGEHDET